MFVGIKIIVKSFMLYLGLFFFPLFGEAVDCWG